MSKKSIKNILNKIKHPISFKRYTVSFRRCNGTKNSKKNSTPPTLKKTDPIETP